MDIATLIQSTTYNKKYKNFKERCTFMCIFFCDKLLVE